MRWIKFPDGSSYTFAADIQKLAELHGYKVPCEADGTRHPGTDCIKKMRTVFKDVSMRNTFDITEQSVVVINADDSLANRCFLSWLAENSIVSNFYMHKGAIQLYTVEAVNALLSVMLKEYVMYEMDVEDEEWEAPYIVTKRSQNLEQKKNKPKASLFKK